MATKRLQMRQIREVLRLKWATGLTHADEELWTLVEALIASVIGILISCSWSFLDSLRGLDFSKDF